MHNKTLLDPARNNNTTTTNLEFVAPFVVGAVRVKEEMQSVTAFEGDVEWPAARAHFLVVMRAIAVEIREFQVIVFALGFTARIEFHVERRGTRTTERLSKEEVGGLRYAVRLKKKHSRSREKSACPDGLISEFCHSFAYSYTTLSA